MIKPLVHDCVVDSFRSVIKNFVPHLLKLRIHPEKFTWAKLFFNIRIINFMDQHLLSRWDRYDGRFYADVQRKILETFDKKVYSWN